ADRGGASETVWRYRARGVVADRGADCARSSNNAVCQRRLRDQRAARSKLAASAAARRPRPPSERAAHGDGGAGLSACRRIRHSAFSSRLLSIFAVFAPADTVRDDAAWPARSAGASTGVRYFLAHTACLDFQRSAKAVAASQLGAYRASRTA